MKNFTSQSCEKKILSSFILSTLIPYVAWHLKKYGGRGYMLPLCTLFLTLCERQWTSHWTRSLKPIETRGRRITHQTQRGIVRVEGRRKEEHSVKPQGAVKMIPTRIESPEVSLEQLLPREMSWKLRIYIMISPRLSLWYVFCDDFLSLRFFF